MLTNGVTIISYELNSVYPIVICVGVDGIILYVIDVPFVNVVFPDFVLKQLPTKTHLKVV